jgi:Tfp pilus assembly protein FimT
MCIKPSTERRRACQGVGGEGFTLIELVIGLISSSLLVAGLASALYISSQTLDLDKSPSTQSVSASEVLGELASDLALARSFTERTSTAVTFTVPDRDGDLDPETIRYAWSGTPGDPLTYQYNGGTASVLADDVQSLNFTALTRLLIAPVIESTPINAVVFEEFTETKGNNPASSVTVAAPPGLSPGDLLIGAVSFDGPEYPVTAPAGWNVIDFGNTANRMHFGVWWKIADVAEPGSYTFNWNVNQEEQVYAWIMRFTGHDPGNPIHQFAVGSGSSDTPTTPSVTTTVDNAMILRLGGFDDDDITVDDTGISGHATITMDRSNTGAVNTTSGGAAYVLQPTAGDSGTADFALTSSEEYRTVTIAIAPNPSP